MIDDKALSELKLLAGEFADEKWNLHENKIDDTTQKWVIYQVGFDPLSPKRLKLVSDAMNLLPELILAAEQLLLPTKADPVEKLIKNAIKDHEERKHK
jgi:hypothetical protein